MANLLCLSRGGQVSVFFLPPFMPCWFLKSRDLKSSSWHITQADDSAEALADFWYGKGCRVSTQQLLSIPHLIVEHLLLSGCRVVEACVGLKGRSIGYIWDWDTSEHRIHSSSETATISIPLQSHLPCPVLPFSHHPRPPKGLAAKWWQNFLPATLWLHLLSAETQHWLPLTKCWCAHLPGCCEPVHSMFTTPRANSTCVLLMGSGLDPQPTSLMSQPSWLVLALHH